jgi:hypothetical protein
MTGRHAAVPDEAFDQRERDRAGAHRADVEPLGPDDAAPVTKPPARKKAAAAAKTAASARSKKAGT